MGRLLRFSPTFFALIATLTLVANLATLINSQARMSATGFDPSAASIVFQEQVVRVLLSPAQWIAWAVVMAMLIRIYDRLADVDVTGTPGRRD